MAVFVVQLVPYVLPEEVFGFHFAATGAALVELVQAEQLDEVQRAVFVRIQVVGGVQRAPAHHASGVSYFGCFLLFIYMGLDGDIHIYFVEYKEFSILF